MKIVKQLMIFCVAAVAATLPQACLAAGKGDGPGIAFAESSYDFGNIDEAGGSVCHSFLFKTTGDEPLVIISATASCGCTRPEFPKNPIQPGEKGEIKVTFVPAGRPGEFSKDVKVRTNAKGKRPTLKIKGVVVPKL